MSDLDFSPTGHFVLIEMVTVQNKTKSGIYLGGTEREQAATQVGVVIGIGPTAFVGVAGCNPEDYPTGHEFRRMLPHQIWGIEAGSLVYYDRYEGQQVKLAGYETHRLVPDMTIKGKVSGNVEISKTDF